jgi:hypothetical protein
VIRRYRGVLASGAWIAEHPPRHRLESAVRNYKRNPHWSPSIGYFVLPVAFCPTYVRPQTFGLVAVDGTHLGELFELEFDQARRPAVIPAQLNPVWRNDLTHPPPLLALMPL